jgi:hypothetical protein
MFFLEIVSASTVSSLIAELAAWKEPASSVKTTSCNVLFWQASGDDEVVMLDIRFAYSMVQ